AVEFTHAQNKKIYITVNSILWNRDLAQLEPYLRFLSEIGVDGIIVSDPAAIMTVHQAKLPLAVHISTQANTTNYLSASFWYEQGARRIVLSREVSLEEIAEIRANTPKSLELEAFVHGSMCV
ncbi:MAG: peptidase U32 family protein, partial [Christensenella sp.]